MINVKEIIALTKAGHIKDARFIGITLNAGEISVKGRECWFIGPTGETSKIYGADTTMSQFEIQEGFKLFDEMKGLSFTLFKEQIYSKEIIAKVYDGEYKSATFRTEGVLLVATITCPDNTTFECEVNKQGHVKNA